MELPPRQPGRARVVLLGGGVTSALAGCALARAGHQVVVVEARALGAGSSSRSAAAIRQQFSTPGTVRGMIHSVRSYERFHDEMACAEGTPRVLVQNGYLFLYAAPGATDDDVRAAQRWARAREAVDMQRRHGLDEVALLDPADVGRRFPHVDPSRLVGATWCPTDGFLRPDLVYGEAFRHLRELGGTVLQWCPVTGASTRGGRLVEVHTPQGPVGGDWFVNATNAWGRRTSRLLGGADLPISPVKRYLYFLQRDGATAPETLLSYPMTISPRGAYCRPENGEQLMAGWAHRARSEPDFTWEDQDTIEAEYFHKHGVENHGYQTWMELAEWMPALAGFAGISATTAGFYGDTPDHNPFLGFDPGVPNLVHACGFSGHGLMMAPFTARAVLALIEGGAAATRVELPEGPVDLAPFAVGRGAGRSESMVI